MRDVVDLFFGGVPLPAHLRLKFQMSNWRKLYKLFEVLLWNIIHHLLEFNQLIHESDLASPSFTIFTSSLINVVGDAVYAFC